MLIYIYLFVAEYTVFLRELNRYLHSILGETHGNNIFNKQLKKVLLDVLRSHAILSRTAEGFTQYISRFQNMFKRIVALGRRHYGRHFVVMDV